MVIVKPPRQAEAPKSQRTRRKIVRAAAAAYRERGIDGVGVRDIMMRAGLTQGGFYFHFADKAALFREASVEGFEGSVEWLLDHPGTSPSERQLEAFIDAYLSARHRDHPESGCMMAALAGDIARSDRKLRKEFTAGALAMLDRIAPHLAGENPVERRQKAGLMLASMAGVLMVSRVLADRAMSDMLLAKAREFYRANFCQA